MSTPPADTLVIIGAGMGAVMLLSALAERSFPPRRILILDPDTNAPRAEAYQPGPASRLLNTRARDMGLTAATPNGFVEFAAQALKVDAAEAALAFLPRPLYGDFLAQGLEAAMAALTQAGADVSVRPWQALAIRAEAAGYRIETDHGPLEAAQCVVLAIGAVRRPLMSNAQSPWAMAFDPKDVRPALIAGAGLTGADAAVDLAERGFRGPIVLASLDGRLPHAQPVAPLAPAALNLEGAHTPADWIARLRAAARETGQDWRAVMDALRPHTQRLWSGLPAPTRRHALSSARMELWGRLRHRLPAPTAARLAALIEKGRLTPSRTRVTGEEKDAALIVDARGFDMRLSHHPLCMQLLKDGVARACATGFGFEPGPDLAIGASGQARLFTLGATLVGARLETTAAPEIRAQAESIAQALATLTP